MKTRIILLITILLSISGLERAKAQETQLDTVWVRWTHDITRLEFSNDDSKILTVGSGGIIIFDTQTGMQLNQIPDYLDAEYSSDNSLIFTVRESADSVNNVFPFVDVFNTNTYEIIKTIKLPELSYDPGDSRIAVSPDFQTIAVANRDGLFLMDYQTSALKKYLYKYDSEKVVMVVYFLFSKDGQHLIFTGDDGKLRFLNIQTYQIDYNYDAGYGNLIQSDDGSMIAFKTGTTGKAVSIMNTQTHEIINSIPGNAGGVTSIDFSSDNNYIGLSGALPQNYANKINIYNLADLSVINTFTFWGSAFGGGIKFSKNYQFLVGGGGPGLVLFNLNNTEIQEPDDNIEILYPNPTNNLITISFELSLPSYLEFNLYDISGNKISNLKSDFYNLGQITENLLLGNLSNGNYFLKIESLQFNKTFKITINK